MEPSGKQKTKARSEKWWKELRVRKIKQVKARHPKGELRCELTGVLLKPDSKANCHHRFPSNYYSDDLDDYRILSAMAHSFVEWLAMIRKDGFPNRELMEAWLGEFLPASERKVDEYYKMMEESKHE